MEHDELDKRFRDLIQNDNSEMNEQERLSKEAIWEEIDSPKKERRVFSSALWADRFWQIAAAVLLLLLGGTSWFFINKINSQELHFAELQKELLETQNSLQTVQHDFAQLELTNKLNFKNNTPTELNQPKEVVEVLKKEFIEKVVYVNDTVFLEKNILPSLSADKAEERIQLVRDTVYIEIPAKQPARLVDLEKKEATPKDKFSKKKKKSQKMEFVFGKKTLEKPAKRNPLILINGSEVAKKTDKNIKNNVITIPINNN